MTAELEYEKGVLEKRKERCFQMCSTAVKITIIKFIVLYYPSHTSEQVNVIGLVSIYIYIYIYICKFFFSELRI